MADYISIPFKRGSYVDLIRPILNYISDVKQYGSPAEYERPLGELQNLRQEFIDKIGDKSEKTLNIFHRYADQIVALELKLPLTENQIRINFKWQDALPGLRSRPNVFLAFASGAYEKACTLFNVAVMENSVAQLQPDTDDGLKTAAKLYQQASGIFTFLHANVPSVFGGAESTNDLKPEILSILATLTLAQAQDVFIKKAMNDNMKPSLLAKLCQQCSFLYEESLKLTQESSLKSILPREWSIIATVKKVVFQALAYFHDGLNYRDNKKPGEAVARLNQAKTLLSKCASNSPMKPFPFANQLKLVDAEAAKAVKDNSFIFHATVPDATKLPDIEKAVLAKPTPVENIKFSPDSQDLLERLLPLSVHQAVNKCEERRLDIVQKEVSRLKNASQVLNNVLVSLNLPAAIEDVFSGRLPKSVVDKSAEVKGLGGYQHLERLVEDFPAMMQRCRTILDESERLLAEEEITDRQLRSKYRHDWTRTPSDILNGPIKEEIRKHKRVIQEALQADALVRQKFSLNKNAIALLNENEDDIQRSLPPVNPAMANIKNQKFYQDLLLLMKQVEQLKDERNKLEERIRNAKNDNTNKFMAALKKDGHLYEESLSKAEIDKTFGPLRELTSRSVSNQDRIIKQIQSANADFEKFKNQYSNVDSGTREAKLKELAAAYDAYMELNTTTKEGNKFYGDFTLLLEKFLQQIKEFCSERNREKDDLIRDMPSIPTQGPVVMGYHPQSAFSTQTLYSALPSATTVVHYAGQPAPQAYFYPGSTPATFNPYSVFLHR